MATTNYSQPGSETAQPNLSESIRLFLASASSYLHARFALLSLEFKDAGVNYVKIIILLVMAIATLVGGFIFLVASAVYLVAWLCYDHWGWVLFGFAFVLIGLSVACLLIAKSRFSVESFAGTIAEFKKDKEWLSQTKEPASRSRNLSVVRTS